MKPSDQYLKIVEWSEKDECYVGRVPALSYGGVHGDNEAKVYAELVELTDELIEAYKEDGMKLPPPTAGRRRSVSPYSCCVADTAPRAGLHPSRVGRSRLFQESVCHS